MSLVNYDSSDDELNEDEECEQLLTSQTSKETKNETIFNRKNNLFSSLPAPKTSSSESSLPMKSLNDIIVKKSSCGPIRISVPSLKHYFEDNDSDEEEKKSKRMKRLSSCGTGLSSILPKPKNTTSITSNSLIPQSLIRPKTKPIIPAPKQLNLNQSFAKNFQQIEDNSKQKMDYFFIDDKSNNDLNERIDGKEFTLSDKEFGPKPESREALNERTYEEYAKYETLDTNSNISSKDIIPNVNDITYKKLIASKFGEESAQDIEIIDIDVNKHLSDSKDWLKTISEEKEEPYNGVLPTSTARRKHQITFLAFQAKQREVELKNQWAVNKMAKTQTRSKYGF